MMIYFYIVFSFDGFIVIEEYLLDWLLKQDIDEDGLMVYLGFEKNIGVFVMGVLMYEWVMCYEEGVWGYVQLIWVFIYRELVLFVDVDVWLIRDDVWLVYVEMVVVVGECDIWVVGGGDLVGQFVDVGLFDEVWVQYVLVMFGVGVLFLFCCFDFEFLDVVCNCSFLCGWYCVVWDGIFGGDFQIGIMVVFIKGYGMGNDFIIIVDFDGWFELILEQVVVLCD